jgi:hypothetical protein
MSESSNAQPQATSLENLELNMDNSLKILSEYINLAQSKGVFEIPESDTMKRAIDVAMSGKTDPEINSVNARAIIVQGVNKGNRGGAYSLADASLLHRVIKYVVVETNKPQQDTTEADEEASAPVPLSRARKIV